MRSLSAVRHLADIDFGTHDQLVLAALLSAVAVLVALAPTLRIPYPILLVLGGLGVGFVPGIPELRLPPDLVLVAFLPPLLYRSAFFTSLRDLRANVRPISLLAVGLVLATSGTVAVAGHLALGLPWRVAAVLGAIVSPTDPVAATAIAQRLGVPRRIVTIVEGESLVNDAVALALYRAGVSGVVGVGVTFGHVALHLLLEVAGGVAIGLAVGFVVRLVRRALDDVPAEVAISLLTGYFAYLPASAAGLSGVLAAVTAGVYVGWHAPEISTVQQRLQGAAVWEAVVFLTNALLFTLVGLQLRPILGGLPGRSTWELIRDAALVCIVVVATRIVWVPVFTYLPRLLFRRVRERDPYPPWQAPAAISWAGMRGGVTLAAALALPLATDAGRSFPDRGLVVFLAFSVVLTTLVVQGLTLPPLIRVLRLEDDGSAEREDAKARIHAAEAALERLEELLEEGWVREDTLERMRGLYNFRRDRFAARFDAADDGTLEERSQAFQRLRRELLDAERAAVVGLRNAGRISDDAMRRVARDLDLEDSRLET